MTNSDLVSTVQVFKATLNWIFVKQDVTNWNGCTRISFQLEQDTHIRTGYSYQKQSSNSTGEELSLDFTCKNLRGYLSYILLALPLLVIPHFRHVTPWHHTKIILLKCVFSFLFYVCVVVVVLTFFYFFLFCFVPVKKITH